MARTNIATALVLIAAATFAITQAIALNAYDVRAGLIASSVLSNLANGLLIATFIRQNRRTVTIALPDSGRKAL